ncbi:MAG TPA: helix-turn-helix transcriptional regulator [Polyangiaceae bacterium]|jgi:transcriptional regulator with XRE-family HTH domain
MREARLDKLLRSIAANVRALRRARKLTQEQLAERAGMDLSYLQRIERAETNLSMDKLLGVADAFGVAPGQLLRPARLPALQRGRPPRQSD